MKISVLGGGSWGTALAALLAGNGHEVALWVYEKPLVDIIRKTGENAWFLPGFSLPTDRMIITNDFEEALSGRCFIVSALPSHAVRSVFEQVLPHMNNGSIVISASKGIENDTLMRMSEIINALDSEDKIENVIALSGPSFAVETVAGHPTAVVAACKEISAAEAVQNVFSGERFRVYTNEDIIGVELCGALKNVMAIAAGICAGLTLGENTRAALITRGLAAISRLGFAMGAHPLTFSGLAGMGDLILTCSSPQSRNFTVGRQIGQGKPLPEILNSMKMVAEGVKTSISAHNLSRKMEIEMPICDQVYRILHESKSPVQGLNDLMNRSLKPEIAVYKSNDEV